MTSLSSRWGRWVDVIDSHTVGILVYDGRKVDHTASGVLLSICGYPYIATAAHNLDKPGMTFRVAYGQPESDPKSDWNDLVGTPVFNKCWGSSLDAAFAPVKAPERFLEYGKTFYRLPTVFEEKFVLPSGALVFVLGYPDEFWDPCPEISEGSIEISTLLYRTTILSTTDDFYAYSYDPSLVDEASDPEIPLPDPTGLSGGGLWLLPNSEEESLRLLGINTDWVRSSRKCEAMFIEAWLAFFQEALRGDQKAKVAAILESTFEGLSPSTDPL